MAFRRINCRTNTAIVLTAAVTVTLSLRACLFLCYTPITSPSAADTAHSHTRGLAYFDSVWEGSCGLHAKSVCCSTAHTHTRGLIPSASDGIRNMLFSTHSHTSHLLHCCFHSVLRLGNCLLCHGSGEVFVGSLFLNSLTCAQLSVKKRLPTSSWARSHASGAGLVRDPRAAKWSTQPQHDGSTEWKTPRAWDCNSHFAQSGKDEEHPASSRSGVTR